MHKPVETPFLLQLARRLEFPRKLGILERLFGGEISKSGLCWVVCSNNVVWKLDLTDPCHRWIVFGKYEGGSGLDCASQALEHGGVYIDSGANIGQWVLFLSGMTGVKTLAFEPVKPNRLWLSDCLNNYPDWDVDVMACGLGSRDFETEIQVDGPRSTLHLDWYKEINHPKNRVQIRRLSDVLEEKGITSVAFWKLDVEGYELDALKGAKRHLMARKIANIFFECHPLNYPAIRSLLTSCGYGLYDVFAGKIRPKLASSISQTEDLLARPLDENDAQLA